MAGDKVFLGVDVPADFYERFAESARLAGRTVEEQVLFVLAEGDKHQGSSGGSAS